MTSDDRNMTATEPVATSITILGVGPGDAQMLTLRGQQALQKADLVVGFKTVLDVVTPWLGDAEVRPMAYRDQEEVLQYAGKQAALGKDCVVCCWGDLNVSARELLLRVKRRVDRVELIPGISSVQMACAKAGISLEDVVFITLHQRKEPVSDLLELVHYLNEDKRHVILLPRPYDLMPAAIASRLVEEGIPGSRPLTIFQRLSLEGESEWQGSLEECAALTQEFSDLTILVFPVPDLHAVKEADAKGVI